VPELLSELKASLRKGDSCDCQGASGPGRNPTSKRPATSTTKRRASYDRQSKIDQQGRSGHCAGRRNSGGYCAGRSNRQYDLSKAAPWSFDSQQQQKQYEALEQAYKAADALLQKFSLKAQVDGVVLRRQCNHRQLCVGRRGRMTLHARHSDPLVVMGTRRIPSRAPAFIDEILDLTTAVAVPYRGADVDPRQRHQGPLEFVRSGSHMSRPNRAVQPATGES